MSDKKKLLKEAVTLEQKKQLLTLSLNVEEAVLKVYKYVSTDIQDKNIQSHVASLKTSIAKFNFQLQEQTDEAEDELSDVNSKNAVNGGKEMLDTGGTDKAFLESEETKEEKDVIEETSNLIQPTDDDQGVNIIDESKKPVKNTRVALEVKEPIKIDVIKEWASIEKKVTLASVKTLTEKLNSNSETIGKTLGEAVQNQFESKIEDFKFQVKNIKSLNEAMNNLYDWADKNSVLIVAKTSK